MESIRNSNHAAVVIGGVNMDICGKISSRMIMRDSNLGIISTRPGGVGRNIAHNLRLLGLDVSLIAAIGGDMYAKAIKESCNTLGIDLSMARILPEERSSTYLYVTDEFGDMQLGINDMDITARVDVPYLDANMDRINRFDAVVLDANLSPESIEFLAERCTRPLYADAVSTVKAMRLMGVLNRLTAIKPNAIEAQALTGESDMELAVRSLVDMGVKRAFISMGANGIIAAERDKLISLPCESSAIVNTTGAGDSATAAIVWSGIKGLSLEDAAAAAIKAGAITCMSEDANSPMLAELPKLMGI
ncbi:MAG: bifunctional hydroxymethylpyrimidine kinase/phosphomethylpyrimidine kinase [Oscillospiraceae bacterium]|nr:bifunctional hydroxymethylpyrimidine kinase/phosphomethylpyrimidine kinase [Oscillospiraceae bacterium]